MKNIFRRRWEEDLDEELRTHMEQRAEDLIRTGLAPEEARRRARIEFGSRESYKEQCREAAGLRWLNELRQDLRYAARVLRRSPGFTLIAVLSLALGVGANTIVFSVVNALVLKPLPIADPARVYFVNNSGQPSQSFPNYRDLRDRNSVFESLFAYVPEPMSLDQDSGAHRVWGYLVTGNYWQSLGIKPALGRFFNASEDVQPNASPYAVLSYTCWKNRFAGDREIAGKQIRIDGHLYTILGVAPAGFQGTEVFFSSEIWVPMMMEAQIEGPWLDERGNSNVWVAGRLKPGVQIRQAEANLNTVAAQLAREYPMDEGMHLTLSEPGLVGSTGRDPTRAFLGAVMLLAVLVLLAACANLASLLAARASDRFRELAIRAAIGAGRGRIVRQLLTESLLISLLGGAAGCAVAIALLRILTQWRAPLDFPVQFDVTPDWRVFLFALTAAVLTGIAFGIAPARQGWKADPAMGMKGWEAPRSRRRWAARDVLLPVQLALCCALVTASLVAVRGLMRSFQTPLGFKPDGVAVIGYNVGLAGYGMEHARLFKQHALEAAAQLPGVESAAYANSLPLSGGQSTTGVYPDGTTDFRPKYANHASYFYVSPGFFQTAGTRLLAGREFTSHDGQNSPVVAIVNETFARRVLGTTNAVGRRFLRGPNFPSYEIAGIVEDGKYRSLTEQPTPALFLCTLQNYSPMIVLMARSSPGRESEVAAEMRQAMAHLDPHLPIYGVGSLHQMLGLVFLPMHAAAIALGAFGVLAIMLSITGIYGLAAYTVSRRVREIGIRIAIGARPSQILRLVFGRTCILAATGAAAGLVLGVAGSRLLASIVYQASSRDPVVVGAAVLSMAIVSVAAALGPARRALRIDPVQALRQE